MRLLCTAAIVMAFFWLLERVAHIVASELLVGEACARVSEGWSYMVKLDDFVPLTAENCVGSALTHGWLPGSTG